jgi:cytochrome P450 family 110
MKLPQGSRLPAPLQLFRWISDPITLMQECARQYGDVFTMHWPGFSPCIFLSHPQAIQELMAADASKIDAGMNLLEPLIGVNSLLALDGNAHERQRKLLLPPFHGERMKAYGDLMLEFTDRVIDQWKTSEPFLVRSAMQDISLQIILRAVFGVEGEQQKRLTTLLKSLLTFMASPMNSTLLFVPALQLDLGEWSPYGKFLRELKEIDQLIFAEIQKRRTVSHSTSEDILSLLLSVQDEDGQPMSDIEIRDELITMLFAGQETTASALAWSLYWVTSTPGVLGKLRDEVASLGEHFQPMEIARLPYLTAVCQETLRIYPVAIIAFPRTLKTSLEIMDWQFEPGSRLYPCIYLTHHRPELYPEPDKFIPERFLDRQFSVYEFFPFGGGNRRCVGMAFALFEMKLALARIVSKLDLALVDPRPLKPVRFGITMAPPADFKLVATRQLSKVASR